MKLYIGSDNLAYVLKEQLIKYLQTHRPDIELIDVGCTFPEDDTPYPVFAKKACEALLQGDKRDRSILICGTGLGMCIVANKFKGIYATVCHDKYSCERSILSNNANVLCLGAKIITSNEAEAIVNQWLSLEFVPSPSSVKLDILYGYEKDNMKGV